ncbi:MAG: single-stranded DNA-binding protein [Patescibacteria group bacterium]|nr:single-stranded DNA-binding protein [Patescibacteria group bacterium]
MTRAAYSSWLAGLGADALRAECAARIGLHRDLDERSRWRDETSGHYGLCWEECSARGRKDLWNAALDDVRRELKAVSRANAEALARLYPTHESEPTVANLNKVLLIGRLTREPETRTFANGGKVASFGFAVNNRKKNPDGSWGDEPVFIDCKAFNRQNGRQLADLVEKHFRKGEQFYLEGHLTLEQWEDKNGGGKRQKLALILDDFQFFEPRQDGGAPSQSQPSQTGRSQTRQAPPQDPGDSYEPGGPPDDIPF